jgi:hypothetical protein
MMFLRIHVARILSSSYLISKVPSRSLSESDDVVVMVEVDGKRDVEFAYRQQGVDEPAVVVVFNNETVFDVLGQSLLDFAELV